jgi:hypothetical protein
MIQAPYKLTNKYRKLLGQFIAKLVGYLEANIDYENGEDYEIHPRSLGGHAVNVRLFVSDVRGLFHLDVAFAMEECVSEDESRAEIIIKAFLEKALYGLRKRPLPTPETTR